MKTVQQVNLNLRQPEQQRTSRQSLDREILAKIWLVMSGMFGTKWTNPYGEWNNENTTIGIWGAALRGLTMDQVSFGLDAISNSGVKFVPTAPEFKEFCVGKKREAFHIAIEQATKEFNANQKRLAHKTINKDVGQSHIDKFFGITK